MATTHTFDIKIAEEYNVYKAILIQNFDFWLFGNQTKRINFNDNRTWCWNTSISFSEQFTYMKPQQIARLLRQLEHEDKVLISGRYNKKGYDKTKWYTFTNEFILTHKDSLRYQTLVKKLTMEDLKVNKEILKSKQPIPDVYTDINLNTFSKEKEIDLAGLSSIDTNITPSIFKDNNSNKNNIPLKKPSILNTIEYKLIEKYYKRLDSGMRLITKEKDYKQSSTIKECISKIKSLLNGTFLNDYPLNNLDSKVINKLNHPLLLNELESLLEESLDNYDLIHQGNFFPDNKKSLGKNLNDFLYCSHNESGWFTYCLKDIKSNKEFSKGQLKSNLDTNIITIYQSKFKNQLTDNQEYNLLLNIKNTLTYYHSYLEKVKDIYRWNPNFLTHFDNELSFCMMHGEYLKRYKDGIAPGHVKLTGAIGDDFARYCLKEYNVNIKPTIDDLLEIEETNKRDDKRMARLKRNEELQEKQQQSSRDREEAESMLASGDMAFLEDFDFDSDEEDIDEYNI